jgi:hypothetical protein
MGNQSCTNLSLLLRQQCISAASCPLSIQSFPRRRESISRKLIEYGPEYNKFLLINVFLLVCITLFTTISVQADVYIFRDEAGKMYFTNLSGEGRVKVHLPLKKEIKKIKNSKSKTKDFSVDKHSVAFDRAIASASELFAVDPDIIRAVIKAESNFNPYAVSPKGALGLMQLMPGTAHEMNVMDPFDPVENIHGGARYLRQLLEFLNGDLPLALAAYNAGPSMVVWQNRIPPIRETRDYVERVLNYYKCLKERNSL